MHSTSRGHTALLTGTALVAFAGNSILCRLALRDGEIDPWSFTSIRLASGALLLLLFLRVSKRNPTSPRPVAWKPTAAATLFVYVFTFSLAYVSLDAGTGSLLLFGTVQITMVIAGLYSGERPTPLNMVGTLTAASGVAWLVWPGVSAPDPVGAALMITAGIAWGSYSLLGRGATQPTVTTARNFALATPIAMLAMACSSQQLSITINGAWLAIASGAITSGLGYALWYMALPNHSATRAAALQLSVPIIAAVGGVAFLGEAASARLLAASSLTISGVAAATLSRR